MTMQAQTFLSDMRPVFRNSFEIDCGKIPAYRYRGGLRSELKAKTLDAAEAVAILEDMLIIREFEEMIVSCECGRL